MAESQANRNAKASVFEDLFDEREMQFALYQVLHPEDTESTIDDVEKITLSHILLRGRYNDLGLVVGKRLMILVEAQSTWSVNIIPRCIMYLADTWNRYAIEQKMNWYSAKKVDLPEAELYVIYTGEHVVDKDVITLSEEFYNGKKTAIDASVKILTYDGGDDIVDQYISFCKTQDMQRKLYPNDDLTAIKETIRICIEQGVLREYLEKRQEEVVNIMLTLFSQQQAHDMEIAAERKEAREDLAKEIALGLKNVMPTEQIASTVKFPLATVESWLANAQA